MEQSREKSSALPQCFGVVAIKKGAFWLPLTVVANFTLVIINLFEKVPAGTSIKEVYLLSIF